MSKETISLRLPPELIARIDKIARATRLKRSAIIELCIEKHIPVIEERYQPELAELAQQEAKILFPTHRQKSPTELNEGKKKHQP